WREDLFSASVIRVYLISVCRSVVQSKSHARPRESNSSCAHETPMISLAAVMRAGWSVFRQFPKIAIVLSMLLLAGCSSVVSDPTGAAVGEQHDLPYTAHDSFLLTQDVLRGEGVLFEVKPDDHLITLWKDADVGAGALGSLVGKHPQYRYEIEGGPLTSRSSRGASNVR